MMNEMNTRMAALAETVQSQGVHLEQQSRGAMQAAATMTKLTKDFTALITTLQEKVDALATKGWVSSTILEDTLIVRSDYATLANA